MCMCPKRFFQTNFLNDVLEHCWVGEPPENYRIATEVTMSDFGKVDFVIADVEPESNSVREFISVELQAVDCTGSVEPAYTALLNSESLPKRPSYGINWANVRKRYVNQLITKGIYHHHWQTRIVSVIQSSLFDYLKKQIPFDEKDPQDATANVVFVTYEFEKVGERHELKLDKIVGTSHSSLMMAGLYRPTPSKEIFCEKIIERLWQNLDS